MRIGKKLYYGFGAILAIVLLLFVVNLSALLRERSMLASSRTALETKSSLEAVRFQMMQNRLSLRNYLLSGDTRDAERYQTGYEDLTTIIKDARARTESKLLEKSLGDVADLERDWLEGFARPLIQKRQQVDAGNATVADLQIFYLEKDPGAWLKKSTDPLEKADESIRKELDETQSSTETASLVTLVVCILGTLLAIGLGVGVAF